MASPFVLNKLHYLGCQSGRKIIHPGLSSQTHSIHLGFFPPLFSSMCLCTHFQGFVKWEYWINHILPFFNYPTIFYMYTRMKAGRKEEGVTVTGSDVSWIIHIVAYTTAEKNMYCDISSDATVLWTCMHAWLVCLLIKWRTYAQMKADFLFQVQLNK